MSKHKEYTDDKSDMRRADVMTRDEIIYTIREYQDKINYMNRCPSLTREEIDQYILSLDRAPVPIDEFIDFYLDNPKQKMEKVALYLKILLKKDFVVDFFIFDPRINVFNCYGDFVYSDCDILNRCNRVSSFFSDEESAGTVSFSGNSPNLRVVLHDVDYDEVFPEILTNRLFEISSQRGVVY